MTCKHCIGAEDLFNEKEARKALKKYRKRGPKGATGRLLNLLIESDHTSDTLLDIGGGIGALQWGFLKNGGLKTTDVDASSAYLSAARNFARENGWEDRTRFLQGDLVDLAPEIQEHDYVTLDKVICCYPSYEMLLKASLSKCRKKVGLTFPMGGWVSISLSKLAALYFQWKKSDFRTYIHPTREVHQLIISEGFKEDKRTFRFPWHIRTYTRS